MERLKRKELMNNKKYDRQKSALVRRQMDIEKYQNMLNLNSDKELFLDGEEVTKETVVLKLTVAKLDVNTLKEKLNLNIPNM